MTLKPPNRNLLPVGLLAGAFALAKGLDYGSGNLRQYLVHGLRAIDPAFLANDWFAAQTPPVHPLFTHVVVLLNKLGPLNLTMGLANGLFSILFTVSLYYLIARFFQRPVLILAAVLLIIVLSPTNCLGWSYIIASYFQPSTIGGVGFLLGLTLLIHRRYIAASGVLAVAGLFHAGYLTWILVIVAAIVIFDWKQITWANRCVLCVPLLLPLAYHAPLLFSATGDPEVFANASRVLQEIYVPQHFMPRTWGPTPFLQFGTVLVLGYAGYKVCPPLKPLNRTAVIVLGACLAIVVFGAILTVPVRVPFVAALFPYRVAPFLRLACYVAIAAAAIDCLVSNRLSILRSIGLCGLLVAGLYYAGLNSVGLKFIVQVMAPALALRAWLHPALRKRRWTMPLRLGPAVAVALAIALLARQGFIRKDTFGRTKPPQAAELYDWCRTHTDRGDVFVVPPDLIDFRLSAGRAVIADWKCMPILPEDTVEWYERLTTVCGGDFPNLAEAVRVFSTLDTGRARAIAREFGARYLVTYRDGRRDDLRPLRQVFANEAYAVLDLKAE